MHPYAYLAVAIISEVIGTAALKYSNGFTRPFPILITVGGYLLAFYAVSHTLKSVPLGITYALWSGLGVLATLAIGYFFFRESLDIWRIGGVLLIVAGVMLLNISGMSRGG
jgi:small multidrug resistance pump